MTTAILILSTLVVLAIAFIITWFDAFLNRNEEFASVQEWHNFRNAMSDKSNKGGK